MSILKDIEKYLSNDIDDFLNATNSLMKCIDDMERVINSITDNTTKKSMLKNTTMCRSLVSDNLDMVDKG